MSAFPEVTSGRRPIGVVSFAQYDNVRREGAYNEVEMLMPVVGAMRSQLLSGTYIQADETPVDVQTHDGSGSNHQAYSVLRMRPP